MAKELILLRHGYTGKRYRNRFVGSMDIPLDITGRKQAASLAKMLRFSPSVHCLCSPLKRARETAEIAINSHKVSIEIDPDLQEVNFGRWEGMTFDEILAKYPEGVKGWANFENDFAFPGGESIKDFLARIRRIADRIIANQADTVMAFAHGGVIRALICHLLGLPPNHYILFKIDPASLTKIELFEGKGALSALNQTGSVEET